MPSFDEPLEAVRINFVMDDGGITNPSDATVSQSEIYRLLDAWRLVVRAGRGAVGSENFIRLNDSYTIVFRFPIYAYLCRGLSPSAQAQAVSANSQFSRPNSSTQDQTFDVPASLAPTGVRTRLQAAQAGIGLEITNIIQLERAWLSSFKVAELSYEQARVLTIEAMVYAENIYQYQRGSSNLPVSS
jgi:hypothetical protein